MAKPEDDFGGYMEDLENRNLQEEAYRQHLANHEVWRQTTWGGFAVRQLQKVGNHFAPFFEAVADLVAAQENTPGQMILVALIRAMTISAYILAAYVVLRLINSMISREIVIEEEIVIEHENDGGKPVARRSARDKKKN